MRGRSVSMAAFALMACAAVPVSSAESQLNNLIPGVRTRLRAPSSINGRVTGTVIGRTADSLSIAMESGVAVRLPLSAITSVDISRGKSRSKGATKGALWGAGVGMLSGLFSDSSTEEDLSRGEVFVAGVLSGVISGALIGALVQAERWERLEVPVHISLIRAPGGPAAAVSIRF